MALLNLSAAAFSIVTQTDYPPRFEGSIPIVISVADSEGRPYTSLEVANFAVQLTWQVSIIEPRVALLSEYAKDFPGMGLPGVYLLDVSTANGEWVRGVYTIAIAVHEDTNHGQIVTSALVTY